MIGSQQLSDRLSWAAKLLILALLIVAVRPTSAFAQTEDDDPVDEQELVDDVNIEDDDLDDDEDDDSLFCAGEGYVHPIVAAIAARYELDDETVAGWFCEDGLGLGQIGLALHTAAIIDAQEAEEDDEEVGEGEDVVGEDEDELTTAEELLAMRLAGYGWGQIWQEYGFVGRPRGESMGLALGRGHKDLDDEEEIDDEDDEDVDDVDDEDVDDEDVDATATSRRPVNSGQPDNPGGGNGGGQPDNPGNGNGGGRSDNPGNGNGGGRPDNPGSANDNKGKGGK